MLLPPESILQFHQGVLSPGAGEAPNPTSLFQKEIQTAIAFLPGAQSWVLGKCQPLFLYFGCASLEDKETLSFLEPPKITSLCTRMGAEPQLSREAEAPILLQLPSG